MPIFDYYCKTCDVTKEKIVSHSDVVIECKECDGVMEKLVSVSSYSYKTDAEGSRLYPKIDK